MEIKSVSRQDISDVSWLIGRAFATYEPMCCHLGVTADVFADWTQNLLESCVDDKMSFHIPSQAAVVAELISPGTVDRYVKHDRSLDPVFEFLQVLGAHVNLTGTGVHIHLVATAEDVVGQGLCMALCQHVIQKAQEKSFDYILVELTTPVTQHVFLDKLGFTTLKEIVYDEYLKEYKGCHGKCVLAVKWLDT